jgi:hypothetical protein
MEIGYGSEGMKCGYENDVMEMCRHNAKDEMYGK